MVLANIFTYNYLLFRAIKLLKCVPGTGGRNSLGRITSYKIGTSRYRRLYHFVDF